LAAFLLVPGAWLGGWCWRDVTAHLQAGGHAVIAATLTGLGERAHLLRPDIGLDTHVADIMGLLHHQDLNDVTLVGHSYGGTVITPDMLRRWVTARLTPHPLRSSGEPVSVRSRAAAALPRTFIRTSTQSVLYSKLVERARRAGWSCRDLDGGHYPMFTQPQRLAAALADLA
jgi:hypothetical protein